MMPKYFFTIVLLVVRLACIAQSDLPVEWTSQFSVEPKGYGTTADLSLIIGGDLKNLECLDGNTGAHLWNCSFRERFDVKEVEYWSLNLEREAVEVHMRADKQGRVDVKYLNLRDGADVPAMEIADRFQKQDEVKPYYPNTMLGGRPIRRVCMDEASSTHLEIWPPANMQDYPHSNKSSMCPITVEAKGGYEWTTTFQGEAIQYLFEGDVGRVVLNIVCTDGKVFAIHEGVTCLDLATGQVLWTTSLYNVKTVFGVNKNRQDIGRAALPCVANGSVYISDFSDEVRSIVKLDVETGVVQWRTNDLKSSDVVAQLVVHDNVLIARYGGPILRLTNNFSQNNYVLRSRIEQEGTNELRAYDLSTGKLLWNSSDLGLIDLSTSNTCNSLFSADGVLLCGRQHIYLLDARTGAVIKKTAYRSDRIGPAAYIYPFDGDLMVEGPSGITRLGTDLSVLYTTRTNTLVLTELRKGSFLLWTAKDLDDLQDFSVVDPATGVISGTVQNCSHPCFDRPGDRMLLVNGKQVTMHRTR